MIREISEEDAESLAKIHRRCFGKGWSEESFRSMLFQKCFAGLAEEDETVIRGFILAQVVIDEAEIVTFCVLPEFRGRGVGKSLLAELMKRFAKGHVKKVFLEVAEDNDEAIGLYKSMGYEEMRRRQNYYRTKRETKNAAVLAKNL
ncbi:MAG: ribosomal protein S18-alanine N-acetyltransferase [Holosporaceae bacterium]|jgi:ribosomal-protein-alanine N-acetyltransferase|nr:ribosomal protein S18-alanine N-acetyltransferase [Holosporaceae bacterium]